MSQSNGEYVKEQREHEVHTTNLAGGKNGSNAPETLKYVSKPEDIDSPIEALEWINSKSTSTANLDPEDVRSKDWVLEYHQLMARFERPPDYGLAGHLRAYVLDDKNEWAEPLAPSDMLEVEGYTEIGKESTTRSKDGWGVETSTRDTRESIVRNDSEESGGGLLGRFKRK